VHMDPIAVRLLLSAGLLHSGHLTSCKPRHPACRYIHCMYCESALKAPAMPGQELLSGVWSNKTVKRAIKERHNTNTHTHTHNNTNHRTKYISSLVHNTLQNDYSCSLSSRGTMAIYKSMYYPGIDAISVEEEEEGQ